MHAVKAERKMPEEKKIEEKEEYFKKMIFLKK